MRKAIIPHDAFVFIGDGRKALFLRNAGDEKFANFVTERVFLDENPLTREQGTDRPGRGFASAHSTRRSVGSPEPLSAVSGAERKPRNGGGSRGRGGDRRGRRRKTARGEMRVVREINKDFTKQPVWEIEERELKFVAFPVRRGRRSRASIPSFAP